MKKEEKRMILIFVFLIVGAYLATLSQILKYVNLVILNISHFGQARICSFLNH